MSYNITCHIIKRKGNTSLQGAQELERFEYPPGKKSQQNSSHFLVCTCPFVRKQSCEIAPTRPCRDDKVPQVRSHLCCLNIYSLKWHLANWAPGQLSQWDRMSFEPIEAHSLAGTSCTFQLCPGSLQLVPLPIRCSILVCRRLCEPRITLLQNCSMYICIYAFKIKATTTVQNAPNWACFANVMSSHPRS